MKRVHAAKLCCKICTADLPHDGSHRQTAVTTLLIISRLVCALTAGPRVTFEKAFTAQCLPSGSAPCTLFTCTIETQLPGRRLIMHARCLHEMVYKPRQCLRTWQACSTNTLPTKVLLILRLLWAALICSCTSCPGKSSLPYVPKLTGAFAFNPDISAASKHEDTICPKTIQTGR